MAKKLGLITGEQFNENYNRIVEIPDVPENDIIVLSYELVSKYQPRKIQAVAPSGTVIRNLCAISLTKNYGIDITTADLPPENDPDLEVVLSELRIVAHRHLDNRKDELRV